jgi:hypothetical protein
MWIRVPGGTLEGLTASAVGAPQFTLGRRSARMSVGLGIGLTRARAGTSDPTSEESLSATSFQVGPALLLDVWRSPDGRTIGNVALGAAIGRLSATDEDTFRDPFTGQVTTTRTETTATLLGFHVGIGGEHFLSPHFAVGLEGGFQGTFAANVKEQGTQDKASLNAQGAYGALRLRIVM